MTNVIHRLSDHVINKIAAGEVIERPASVVKELVENSLDAGATKVEVAIEAGGKNFIQVLDNGSGMSRDDALLALDRHATSKMSRIEDLEQIHTMGFRGEALPSIAAVSRFELRTRREEDEEGTSVNVVDGRLQQVDPVATTAGTRITVRNLFFSTPARRKFLTSNQNELKHILVLLRRIALVRPELHFVLVSDGEEVFDWPGGDLDNRVIQVFGREMPTRLLKVRQREPGLDVSGFIGKVNTFRRSHGDQYLFINGRPVSNRMINHAVFSSYGHTLGRDQVPFYLLFLESDPAMLDVNVHPAKKEVRFADERWVYRQVHHAVTQALASHPVSNFDLNEDGAGVTQESSQARPELRLTAQQRYRESGDETLSGRDPLQMRQCDYSVQDDLFRDRERVRAAENGVRHLMDSVRMARERFPEPRSETRALAQKLYAEDEEPRLFQLHNTYIFAPVESGVVIVDQHVAHERVLYEQCLGAMQERRAASQRLLFPVELDLDEELRLVFEEVHEHLFEMGFTMEMQGTRVMATGVPTELPVGDPRDMVREILEQYRVYLGTMPEPRDALAASVACKAAIKAGQPLKQEEMRSLLEQLFACKQPFTCPHGRPVVINLGIEELHRRFMRE